MQPIDWTRMAATLYAIVTLRLGPTLGVAQTRAAEQSEACDLSITEKHQNISSEVLQKRILAGEKMHIFHACIFGPDHNLIRRGPGQLLEKINYIFLLPLVLSDMTPDETFLPLVKDFVA